jgi:peptidoglycan-N-acetylglucosamine deacetylase
MEHRRSTTRGALPRLFAAVITALVTACDGSPRPGAASSDDASDVAVPASDASDDVVPTPPAVAITIDDLPWIGAFRPGETRGDALRRLADTLRSREVPAIGFANCDRAEPGSPLLRMWLDAGLELGNHTAAHLDLNDAPIDDWLRDVRSCHDVVRKLTNAARIWFRYPFLHQGPTPDRQAAALALLRELDSPIAHVTIDNSDWILAVAYGEAITAGDSMRAAAIGDAFVEHILRATVHYQDVARSRVGRDVPHVLLLHANLLVADWIGTLLDRLRAEHGVRFVSLEAALRDPVYARPDGYTGADGLSWLYRLEPSSPAMKEWDDMEAARLRERWR